MNTQYSGINRINKMETFQETGLLGLYEHFRDKALLKNLSKSIDNLLMIVSCAEASDDYIKDRQNELKKLYDKKVSGLRTSNDQSILALIRAYDSFQNIRNSPDKKSAALNALNEYRRAT